MALPEVTGCAGGALRMCTEAGCAAPPHVENCPVCFGWGLIGKEYDPDRKARCGLDELGVVGCEIEAARASGDWRRCPECGGTPEGIVAA